MRILSPLRDLYEALRERERGPILQRRSSSPSTVGPALGDTHTCWCGAHSGHDWPLKDIGAAHPRYP